MSKSGRKEGDTTALRRELASVLRTHQGDSLTYPTAYSDGGCEPLWARFERAASNQIENGAATVSRYAIWANTVRCNLLEGVRLLESGCKEEGERHIVRAANSLAAFSDFQAAFSDENY